MKTLTKKKIKEYEDKMTDLSYLSAHDTSQAHIKADELLEELLKELGLTNLAKIYNKVEKWYD